VKATQQTFFAINFSGVHHKKKTCDPGLVVQRVKDVLVRAKGFLYPKNLHVSKVAERKRRLKYPNGNGGWGDIRDHNLCLSMAKSENASLIS